MLLMRRMMGKLQFTLKRGGNRVFGGWQKVSKKSSFSNINLKDAEDEEDVVERRENVCGRQLWMQLLCNCLFVCIHRGTIRDDDDQLISVIDNQFMCVVCCRDKWKHMFANNVKSLSGRSLTSWLTLPWPPLATTHYNHLMVMTTSVYKHSPGLIISLLLFGTLITGH